MRNKFAGECYKCNLMVEAGQGHFERHNGGWRTIHASCTLLQREEKAARLTNHDPLTDHPPVDETGNLHGNQVDESGKLHGKDPEK